MKIKKLNEQKVDLDFGLTDEQKEKISSLFKKMMFKYDKTPNSNDYFDGVVDGINHCYKAINGVEDDYLDGI